MPMENQKTTSCIPNSYFTTGITISILAILSIISNSSSLNGEFVYDDSEAIVNNIDIKSSTSIWLLFQNDFWGRKLDHKESHKSYRPITIMTFRFNLDLAGGKLEPFNFHAVNLILHAAVTSLSLFVFQILFPDEYNQQLSFLASLIFAVHPVHTEAIAGIVGRADLLCTFFSFCALLLYAKGTGLKSITASLCYVSLSILLSALAMLSKEQGITSIGICSAYDIIVVNKIYPLDLYMRFKSLLYLEKNKHLKKNLSDNILSEKSLKLLMLRQLILCLGGIIILIIRWYIMGRSLPTFQKVDNPASFIQDVFYRVVNYNYIYALNAYLLICPVWLCCDWSMGCIPLIDNILDKRCMVVAVFWTILGSLLISVLKSNRQTTSRSVLMSLTMLIVPFLPASNLFFQVGFVIAERVLYLPSAGYCMLIALGCRRLCLLYSNKMLLHFSLIVLILSFSFRSYKRSMDWKNELTLFTSALSVCPLNAKVHYNIGKTIANQSLAIEHYKEAIRLHPEYDQAMNNLANILKEKGNYEEAESFLRNAVRLRPDFSAAWMNLGIVLSHINNFKEAEICYANALKFRKHYPDCYYNLGNLYLSQKMYREATEAWTKATMQQPNHRIAWNNLIIMLDSRGELSKAVELAKHALDILPNDSSINFNIANTLGKLGKFEEAERHFKTAIKIRPDYALHHVNLGVLYHRWKKFHLAKMSYEEALKIDPNMKSAKENLVLLKEK